MKYSYGKKQFEYTLENGKKGIVFAYDKVGAIIIVRDKHFASNFEIKEIKKWMSILMSY